MAVLERNKNLSQRMTHELGKLIVSGEYSQSNRIPSEAELCEQFGVSRTAVREAVKMLTAKGLISSRPRQGIRVLNQDQWNILDSDVLKWSLEAPVTSSMLKEQLQMRLSIEPEAAFLAASIASAEQISSLESHVIRLEKALQEGDSDKLLLANIDFFVGVLYASANRFYVHMKDFTKTALSASAKASSFAIPSRTDITELYVNVLNAIKQKNATLAKEAMLILIKSSNTQK